MDLFALNYRFAAQQVDPRIGSIQMSSVTLNQTGKTIWPIDVVDCKELENDEDWENFFRENQIKYRINKGDELLCPRTDRLGVEG